MASEITNLKLTNGHNIPLLGFGTGSAYMKQSDDAQVEPTRVMAIASAIQMGYHHIDAAEAYNNEREVGAAIKESKIPREKLFITSKALGFTPIEQSLNTSLEKLGLDYVDLYLLHLPWLGSDDLLKTAWAQMESVQASGKARSIGVSNFSINHLEAILSTAKIVPAINQLEISPYLQRKDTRSFNTSKGIATAAYAPLGPLSESGKGGPLEEYLKELAKKYEVDESEILLRWCIDNDIVAITTSRENKRLVGYLKAFCFKLTKDEMEVLNKEGSKKVLRKYFTDKYDEKDSS